MWRLFSSIMILIASLGFGAARSLAEERCQRKSKHLYPIVLTPHKRVVGFPVNSVRGYTFDGQRWRNVALQVDEVNERGEYVLRDGMPFTAYTDDGILDEHDEMAFMGIDLGQDFTERSLTSELKRTLVAAWKVKVCQREKLFGYLLVGIVKDRPPEINASGVKFDRSSERVETDNYVYHFKGHQPVLLGDVFLKDKNQLTPIFEDSAFLLAFRLPWYLPNVTLSDRSFESQIESWQSGPVRTIVAVGVKLKDVFSVFNFHMFSELVFYKNYFQIPTVMEFPFDATRFFEPGSGLVYSITMDKKNAWRLVSTMPPLPAKVPTARPRATAEEGREGAARRYRASILGPQSRMEMDVRVAGPDGTDKNQLPTPYWINKSLFSEEKLQKEWEWLQELDGDAGIFVDISGVRQGIYNFSLDLLLEPKAETNEHEIVSSSLIEWMALPLN